MVATIKVLSGVAMLIIRYLLTRYYADQSDGEWFGLAAARLGLAGKVTRRALEAVLTGRSPTGRQLIKPLHGAQVKRLRATGKTEARLQGQELQSEATAQRSTIPNASPTRTRKKLRKSQRQNVLAVDLQFAVMKSLSLLWALCPSLRPRIEQIIRESVQEVLAWLESSVPLARRGKNGVNKIHAELVAATFMHTISRAEEPQLHVHCLVMQMVRGSDGKWCKLDSMALHRWTPTLGRLFRATLAQKLQGDLGLELIRPVDAKGHEKSWFEIKGIKQELIDAASSRRKEVLAASGPQGRGKGREAARQRQDAAYKTRKAKEKRIDIQQVFDNCRKQARDLGVRPEALENLIGRARPILPEKRQELYRQAFDGAIKKLSKEVAHFGERDLICEIVERLQHHGFKGTELADRIREEIPNRTDLIPLQDRQGERRFATKQTMELEARFLKDVEKLRARKGALLTHQQTEAVIREHKGLSLEQKKAVRRLLSRKRAIRVLAGVAGAGKSTALAAVRQGFEKAGYRVIGGALAGTVATDLEAKTGIKSRTVASHLWRLDKPLGRKLRDHARHHARMLIRELRGRKTWTLDQPKLDSKTVLVIDEAGMLGTKQLAALTRLVRKAKATLILAGDDHQLPPIEAGAPFSHLLKTLPAAELKSNQRQQDPGDKHAVSRLREGKAAEALKSYADQGRLIIANDSADAVARLVAAWRDAGGLRNPKHHQIVVQTRRDAQLINRLCQQERLDALAGPPGHSVTVDGDRFFRGDRVIFYEPVPSQGVRNGEFGIVVAVNAAQRMVAIRLEHPRTKEELARGYGNTVTISLPTRENETLKLATACTTHKLQGATVDNAYLLLQGPLTSKEMAYVQATRARFSTQLFVDRQQAGKSLADLERSLTRSRAKEMAHDLIPQHSRG